MSDDEQNDNMDDGGEQEEMENMDGGDEDGNMDDMDGGDDNNDDNNEDNDEEVKVAEGINPINGDKKEEQKVNPNAPKTAHDLIELDFGIYSI